MQINRRTFLGASSKAVLVAGAAASGRVFGANNRVRAATVGVRGRGWDHVRAAQARGDVEVTALCDVDAKILDNRAAELRDIAGRPVRAYRDMRDLMADKDVDVVTFATPNHWHVLGAVWAMQAGKDVYLEKPVSHTIWEGRQLAAAQKKYGRVFQHGTQRRSEPVWQRMVERVRGGAIGDVYMIRCLIMRRRDAFWFPPQETPPPELDWTLWQGPAPEQPFSRNYVHYTWHWFWHYGNGEIGNNGPHPADLANWVWDQGLPVSTSSTGGIFGYDKDARQTPNTQVATHTFANGKVMVFDIRNRYTNKEPGLLLLYGTEGHGVDTTLYDKEGKAIPDDQTPPKVDSTAEHMANFIGAVKAQEPAAVNATAEQGHVAAALCHLGNIAYRTGRTVKFDPATETFDGDDEANALLTRPYREGFAVPKLA